MAKVEKCYKIRRISDGLYSTGGDTPKFTNKGKSWGSLGPLRNHLAMFKPLGYMPFPYDGCVIDEFEWKVVDQYDREIEESPKDYMIRRKKEKIEEEIKLYTKRLTESPRAYRTYLKKIEELEKEMKQL